MTTAPGQRPGPPVLILGSHRSGTSAVAGLLTKAGGLELGEVMPGTPANPKGYFESVAIVRAHNTILSAMDRDWTCPPPDFDIAPIPREALEAEVRALDATGQVWGVKDPRLLFMLPAWVEVLPEFRFVGVIRDHEEVVRSLVARDGLEPGVADTITRAHVRRLRVLADRFSIPIIDFSAGPEEVLGRTGELATSLGLRWDRESAAAFLDPTLRRNRATGMSHSGDIEHLRTRSDRRHADTVDAASLREVLDELAKETEEFDRYSGPRANARRAAAWRAVPGDVSVVVEFVRNQRVAASMDPVREGGISFECSDLWTMTQRWRGLPDPPEAVVLPDLTSWLDSQDLAAGLTLLHQAFAPDGLVVVGISLADRETCQLQRREPVSLEDLLAAARASGFVVLSVDTTPTMTVVRLLPVTTTTSLLRSAVDRLDKLAGATHETGTGAVSRRADVTFAGTGRGTSKRQAKDGSDEAALWRYKYLRLRGRRSVRLTLALASLGRPLFRMVRRLKKARRDG